MTPLMVGSAVTSVLAGVLTSKTGKYRLFPIVGGAVMAVGMYLLSRLGVHHLAVGHWASTSWSSASAWAA